MVEESEHPDERTDIMRFIFIYAKVQKWITISKKTNLHMKRPVSAQFHPSYTNCHDFFVALIVPTWNPFCKYHCYPLFYVIYDAEKTTLSA